jgi:L-threonylcarbamoyladenylate synthase
VDRAEEDDGVTLDAPDLARALDCLRQGGIVLFPTDTFYGLAVDPTSDAAVRRLFDLKGRSARTALPLVAASVRQVEAACGPLGDAAARLAARCWPGPLSILLDAPANISVAVHGGSRAIAVRVPAHAVARALAEGWGGLLTATSANRSGEPPATTVDAIGAWAAEAGVYIVDGGATAGGAPSTIVDVRGPEPVLVREGAIPWRRVLESLQG